MCFSVSRCKCTHACMLVCVTFVCVGLLYTVLWAKTLEIALIWILCVSSNHNHVTGSPRQERLIHGAERRPSCMLLLYILFTFTRAVLTKWLHPHPTKTSDGQKRISQPLIRMWLVTRSVYTPKHL